MRWLPIFDSHLFFYHVIQMFINSNEREHNLVNFNNKNKCMITILWILKGLLAFVFLMAGAAKLIQTREKVIASAGKWAEDFTDNQVKLIGAIEVILAVLLVVPKLLGHGYFLTCIAAFGMAAVMSGAAFTHLRRKEFPFVGLTVVFMIMALVVAYFTCPYMQYWEYL